MKALNLLFTLVMVFAFNFVNAAIPENIYFPTNVKYQIVNEKVPLLSYEYYDATSCRYNHVNNSAYCEFNMNGGHYRVRFFFKNNDECNVDEQNLVRNGNIFYFKEVITKKDICYSNWLQANIVGEHKVAEVDNKEMTFTTNNCTFKKIISKYSIYKV